ncbi:MAG: response regulator, partial [Planctomycetes bacterium]|nr:response regulator [Planctomycetota bacterium]
MKLLLVDDHADARASLAGFLDQLGHAVLEADCAERALALCRDQHPDLVLSDLRMPGMSGLELLQALESLDQPPPVALMTAFGDTDTAIEAVRLGAIDYLRKPIDVAELHRLVERVAAERAPAPPPIDPAMTVDGLVVAGATVAKA